MSSQEEDGFEEFLSSLKEKAEKLKVKLYGGNEDIRKPKKPLTVFLRFHMEKFNQIKMKNQDWTPNKVTQFLKRQWDTISDSSKDRYVQSYEQDMKKYEKLVALYSKLTQKPKKPITPYFQFFSENIEVYKKNYPEKSHNEITKLVGNDWNNFDSKKKNEMMNDYQKQKLLYEKQVAQFQQRDNEYIKYDDYNQKLEDYERELEEELDNIRTKFPKAPTANETRKKQKIEQMQIQEEEKKEQEKRKNDAPVVQKDKSEDGKEKDIETKIEEESDVSQHEQEKEVEIEKTNSKKGKKSQKQTQQNQKRGGAEDKVQLNKRETKEQKLQEKSDDKIDRAIKAALEESRSSLRNRNRREQSNHKETNKKEQNTRQQSVQTRSPSKRKQEPVKIIKQEKFIRSRSQEILNQRQQPEKKSTSQAKESRRSSSSTVAATKSANNLKSKPKEKPQAKAASRSSTRIKEQKENEKKVQPKSKDQSKKKENEKNDSLKNIRVLKRKSKRGGADQEEEDDIEEEVPMQKGSLQKMITHILGMKEQAGNGKIYYLIRLKNNEQYWAKPSDNVFENTQNQQKLQIFLKQIKKQKK